jgi:hypothetical protein
MQPRIPPVSGYAIGSRWAAGTSPPRDPGDFQYVPVALPAPEPGEDFKLVARVAIESALEGRSRELQESSTLRKKRSVPQSTPASAPESSVAPQEDRRLNGCGTNDPAGLVPAQCGKPASGGGCAGSERRLGLVCAPSAAG